jgi:hypothetical protein
MVTLGPIQEHDGSSAGSPLWVKSWPRGNKRFWRKASAEQSARGRPSQLADALPFRLSGKSVSHRSPRLADET